MRIVNDLVGAPFQSVDRSVKTVKRIEGDVGLRRFNVLARFLSIKVKAAEIKHDKHKT